MAEWIALDETTRLALRDALGAQGTVSMRSGSALKAALDSGQDCAVVLPGEGENTARLVSIKRQSRPVDAPPEPVAAEPVGAEARELAFDYVSPEKMEKSPAHNEATGFLGLSDEVVYDDEPAPPAKKAWWKKLVE